MPLIKGGRFVTDPWRHLADGEGLPDAPRVTVTYARWVEERESLRAFAGSLGLRLPNDVSPAKIEPDLDRFALVILNFPRFTDGRAYSQARLLRGRMGFTGELRADGEVLRDQLLFMQRVGFDAWNVGERALAEDWLKAFGEFDVFYQGAEDDRVPLYRRRLAEARHRFTVA